MSTPSLGIAFVLPVPSGHSNIHLATIRALLSLPLTSTSSRPLNIHVISDEPLRRHVDILPSREGHKVFFHPLGETDTFAEFTHDLLKNRPQPVSLFKGAFGEGLSSYKKARNLVVLPSHSYMTLHEKIKAILEEVRPDLVVVDIMMAVGIDACEALNLKWGMLAPVSSLDVSIWMQPFGGAFWKYPALFSSIPYPVPFSQILHNFILAASFLYLIITTPQRKEVDKARHAAGLKGSVLRPVGQGAEFVIHPSVMSIEYPHVPLKNAVLCGPILTPDEPLSAEKYPELGNFLENGRVAYVNLGSLFKYHKVDVTNMCEAFMKAQTKLKSRGGLKVLWKLPGASEYESLLRETLGEKFDEWIRVENWIEARALEILQHPNVVVTVHHGGANSVHEGCYAGVPQILLPQWYDLYTFARRVEYLGHGIYANKGHEASIHPDQLADALVHVFSDGEGEAGYGLKVKARELSKACREAGGDKKAAETVLSAALGTQNTLEQKKRM